MASGTGSYFLALSGTLVISVIAFILYYTNFGSIIKSEFILQFRLESNDKKLSEKFNKIISSYTKSYTLLSSEASDDGKSIKASYDLVMKEEKKQTELLNKLTEISGLSEIVIIAAKSDVDY